MTPWNAILSWFYRDFPCGCRVARRWDGAWVCKEHRDRLAAGEQVILESKKINPVGITVKFRSVR
jgi:hypothetical protein